MHSTDMLYTFEFPFVFLKNTARKSLLVVSVEFPGETEFLTLRSLKSLLSWLDSPKCSVTSRMPRDRLKFTQSSSRFFLFLLFFIQKNTKHSPQREKKSLSSPPNTNVGKGREDSPALVGREGEKRQSASTRHSPEILGSA